MNRPSRVPFGSPFLLIAISSIASSTGLPSASLHADEALSGLANPLKADESLSKKATWQRYDAAAMAKMLRASLDEMGVIPSLIDEVAEDFLSSIESDDLDPLDAYVSVAGPIASVISQLAAQSGKNVTLAAAMVDPNAPAYGALESLPKSMRMTIRTWLGRELVRARLYDEALPVIAEVDPAESIDPAAALFYRGACYHALMMKTESLADLRRLLENKDMAPVRFTRTAQLMVADIKPLEKDSLDEVSRLMTDVTRRLDLGRHDENVKSQEQKIIDKLTKLIEKIEEQQKQQQQQMQQQAGGKPSGGDSQSTPMQDSNIASGSGNGDVDRKGIDAKDGWGNLPPAERNQAIQQISRDLPTHYREAIEAYFRKLATDGS